MISALAIATLIGGGSCTLVEAARIDAPDGRLTLADVIAADCPALAQTGDLVVAALPRGTNTVLVSRVALVSLVRRRAPGLAIALPVNGSKDEVELRRTEQRDLGAGPSCFELTHAVAPQAALTGRDVTMTPCTTARTPLALAYDNRHAIVRAAEASDAGHYLGPLVDLPADLIEQGEALQLRVAAGPVTIARDIVAVQSAHTGETLFVRDADGHIFSAPSTDIGEVRP